MKGDALPRHPGDAARGGAGLSLDALDFPPPEPDTAVGP